MYRICKIFEIESGHFLYKHPEKCKNPHGHSRKVEIVLTAQELDKNDMVCDFKVLKLAVGEFIDSFDHAMMVNSDCPDLEFYKKTYERVISVSSKDPTTEVLSKIFYGFIKQEIAKNLSYLSKNGAEYKFSESLILEKVRVYETSSSWAEYSE